MADWGYAPYEEAQAKGMARMSTAQRIAQLLQGAAQGISATNENANPLEAAVLGFGRSYGATQASHAAAQQYAMKQQAAMEARKSQDIMDKYHEAQIVALGKERGPQPTQASQQYADLMKMGHSQQEARQIAYGLLPGEKEKTAGTEVMTMSEGALTNAAKVYANTGQLPPMGMARNASGLRVSIMEKAAKLYPDLNITQNRANYSKDLRALTETQRLYDLSTAFEQTASRNGDVMLEAARGIPDTGTQFGNRIARYVATQTGSPAMARFHAALETLKAEYAKILSSPGTAGGVLTDNARREMEKVVGGNQTKAQLVNSLTVLRRDAANKRGSYADKIREIQSRIGPASFGAQNLGGNPTGDVEWNMDENGNLVPANQ